MARDLHTTAQRRITYNRGLDLGDPADLRFRVSGLGSPSWREEINLVSPIMNPSTPLR